MGVLLPSGGSYMKKGYLVALEPATGWGTIPFSDAHGREEGTPSVSMVWACSEIRGIESSRNRMAASYPRYRGIMVHSGLVQLRVGQMDRGEDLEGCARRGCAG